MTPVRIGSRAVKRLWALQGATLNQDTSLMMLGLPPGPLAMPVPFFLIEHDRGLLLYDTGMAPSAAEDPAGTYGPLLAHMGLEFEPEQRIDRRLATLGLTCADVTHVVLSHPNGTTPVDCTCSRTRSSTPVPTTCPSRCGRTRQPSRGTSDARTSSSPVASTGIRFTATTTYSGTAASRSSRHPATLPVTRASC